MARVFKVQIMSQSNVLMTVDVAEETLISSLIYSASRFYNYPILGALMDNEVVSLDTPIVKNCNIVFFTKADPTGNYIYSRSVHMMLALAVKRLYGKTSDIVVQNSIDNGVLCELVGVELSKDVLKNIETEMKKIVKEELSFTSLNVRRMDVIKYLKKQHAPDVSGLLKYLTDSFITIYRLDDFYDISLTPLASNTRDLDSFKLTYIKDQNFVLSVPGTGNPDVTLNYKHVPIIYNTFIEYNTWENMNGISNVSDLNKIVSEGKSRDIIRVGELYYEGQLHDLADDIYEKKDSVKMVLLAGPSSSGKTTTANKLSYYLKTRGFNTIVLSTDDYFLEREETPKDENGEYDFETINAIDLKLFNKQMSKLLEGERVLTPEFNFVEGKKEFRKKWIQLKENDILIIEGLHCLNEELTTSIPRKNKYKVFVGPFTQLNLANHIRIHTSDTRRLRRIIRDNRTRGKDAATTLRMWHKIRLGEEKYIYPFEKDADCIINSSLVYELGVLKTFAEPLLFSVEEDDPVYPEALRLIDFLRNILPIPSDDIPRDSVLREFIGGSGFYNE